jgi:hypothetical protein
VRRVAIDGRFICVQERAGFDQATTCFTTVPSGAFSSIVSWVEHGCGHFAVAEHLGPLVHDSIRRDLSKQRGQLSPLEVPARKMC